MGGLGFVRLRQTAHHQKDLRIGRQQLRCGGRVRTHGARQSDHDRWGKRQTFLAAFHVPSTELHRRTLARCAVHAAGRIGPCRTALSSGGVTIIRKSRRIFGTAALMVGGALAAAAAVAWLTLRASLPSIDGYATLPGIAARVSIERDAMGVPTIKGRSRDDLARGLGYVHGQDRFFQMGLVRRAAAGELSALLGPALLPTDRQFRLHRFRAVARAILGRLDPADRASLDAYVAGVNAGLSSLRSRPFEYWVLNSKPQPWSAEDRLLCVDAMF